MHLYHYILLAVICGLWRYAIWHDEKEEKLEAERNKISRYMDER